MMYEMRWITLERTAHPSTFQPLAQGGAHSAVVAEHPARQSEQEIPPVADVKFVKHPSFCGISPNTFTAQREMERKNEDFIVVS